MFVQHDVDNYIGNEALRCPQAHLVIANQWAIKDWQHSCSTCWRTDLQERPFWPFSEILMACHDIHYNPPSTHSHFRLVLVLKNWQKNRYNIQCCSVFLRSTLTRTFNRLIKGSKTRNTQHQSKLHNIFLIWHNSLWHYGQIFTSWQYRPN